MKLCYNHRSKNFGDKLNGWLWPKIVPDIFDEDETQIFVGIGTILNQKLTIKMPNAKLMTVFSSGVGYGKRPKNIDSYLKFYCVRGPLSAKALDLPSDLAITDGAVLIKKFCSIESTKVYKYSYMPHTNFAGEGWKLVCQRLGFGYIDPHWSIEKIVSSIQQTEILLSEAMHGAIVADLFRVPWIAVRTHKIINPFKWQDWCYSMNLEYQPQKINRLHHPRKNKDILSPLRAIKDWQRQKAAGEELSKIALKSSPLLSKEKHLDEAIVKLEAKLAQLETDFKSGFN